MKMSIPQGFFAARLLAATALLTVAALAAGCATNPDKISAQSVSHYQYRDYDCEDIALELERVGQRVGEIYAQLKRDADNDAWQMGVGLVLFWPALLALEGGDGPNAQEYARLKGEYEALQKEAIRKKCDKSLLPSSPFQEAGTKKPQAEKSPGDR